MATGTVDDPIVRVWNLADGSLRANYTGHAFGGVNQVVFSPDGSLVGSAGTDGDVGLWPVDVAVAERAVCAVLGCG